jgi:type IV secretion system protein VirB11
MSQIASFRTKLAPLTRYLDDRSVTEIAVNRPGEAWIGRQGSRYMERVEIAELTLKLLSSLADVTAHDTDQATSREQPLLSATIPINLQDNTPESERGGYRIQIVQSPAVEARTIGICIRKPALLDFSLSEYAKQGAFKHVNKRQSDAEYSDSRLKKLYKDGDWEEFFRGAVRSHKNIVISAGTNAGKTTFLNALLKEIPEHERIVTIEDSREIRPPQPNCLHMVYSRGGQGVANVTAVDLLQASLRLTPDRAIMGELRGEEAYSYLELLNSGHTGSITTIHADSPALMYDRLAQMVMRARTPLGKEEIIAYAKSLIHVVVQLKRDSKGHRYISEVLYEGD